MKAKLTLAQKGMLVIGIPCLLQLTFFAINGNLLEQTEQLALKEYHNKEVIGHANWLMTLMAVASLSAASYATTGDKSYRQIYEWCAAAVPVQVEQLTQIVSDSRTQEKQIEKIKETWQRLQGLLNRQIQDRVSANTLSLPSIQDKTKSLGWELFNARHQLLDSERSEFVVGPTSVKSARRNLSAMVSLGVGLNIAIAFALFFIFTRGITSRLNVLSENSVLLARGAKINPPLSGSDEIVQLDRTFHEMADALAKAHESLKASEQRMFSMIEKMPVGLILIGQEEAIEFANPTMEQIFAYQSGAMKGVHWRTVLASYQGSLSEQDTENRPLELQVVRRDGQPITVEILLKRISMQDGEKTLLFIQDVTERHEIERLKNAFVAMVTHDLRTPLNSIRLFHQLIAYSLSDGMPVALKENLGAAERSTARLLSLVNDLLDFGKLEAGKLEMRFGRTSVSSVIDRAVEGIKCFADKHEVKIAYAGSEIEIIADGDRLVQVLVNLLSNAVKFSPNGSTVTIAVAKQGDLLEISVADQGRGIPASHKDLVFSHYGQVEMSDGTREKGGVGLGLSICKAIVQQHGGTIGVESEVGKGSCFWIRIPIAQRQIGTTEQPHQSVKINQGQ